MARLAIVGSFSVNGVAKLHTEILKKQEMKHFYSLFPERFNNKTNGITHRRWLLQANPKLSALITESIGSQWIQRPNQLINLLKYSSDQPFLEKVNQVKLENKQILAKLIHDRTGILVDDQSIFDVQVKRLHEYKRQLLKVFHIMYLYDQLKASPNMDITPTDFYIRCKSSTKLSFSKRGY